MEIDDCNGRKRKLQNDFANGVPSEDDMKELERLLTGDDEKKKQKTLTRISKKRVPSWHRLMGVDEFSGVAENLGKCTVSEAPEVLTQAHEPEASPGPTLTYMAFEDYTDDDSCLDTPQDDVVEDTEVVDYYNRIQSAIYHMNEKLSWTFGNQLRGRMKKDVNVVGEALLDASPVIYKTPKYPSFGIYWERDVSKHLKEYLPSIKHFARAMFIARMPLQCDSRGRCMPRYPNGASGEPWRDCNILVQKLVPGVSFAETIEHDTSYRKMFSGMYQVLASLQVAQYYLGYTNNDLHTNNILMKDVRQKGDVQFLYDAIPDEDPLAIPCYGYKAVIIDQEFAYIHTVNGRQMDCAMNNLPRGFDPTTSDQSIDVLRFVVSAFTHHVNKHPSLPGTENKIESIYKEMVANINSLEEGKLESAGYFEGAKDNLYDSVYLQQCLDVSPSNREFVEIWFYKIIGLLCHKIRLPLKGRVEKADTTHVGKIFKKLCELTCSRKQHRLRILYEIVYGRDLAFMEQLMKELKITYPQDWIVTFKKDVDNCIPHLETALYKATLENKERRKKQRPEMYSPENTIRRLAKFYNIHREVTNKTTVYWMTKTLRTKVSLKRATQEQLDHVNDSAADMFELSRRLKSLVETLTRYP